jgi:hypothetical protein
LNLCGVKPLAFLALTQTKSGAIAFLVDNDHERVVGIRRFSALLVGPGEEIELVRIGRPLAPFGLSAGLLKIEVVGVVFT